jgi:uncharacterized membrane protein YfhO
MAEQSAKSENRSELTLMLVAALLIGSFLWRALAPAHEYPMRSVQILTMVFDLGLIAALIGMKSRAPKLKALFWVALVAGIGLFANRLNGDASWWTGHLVYQF